MARTPRIHPAYRSYFLGSLLSLLTTGGTKDLFHLSPYHHFIITFPAFPTHLFSNPHPRLWLVSYDDK